GAVSGRLALVARDPARGAALEAVRGDRAGAGGRRSFGQYSQGAGGGAHPPAGGGPAGGDGSPRAGRRRVRRRRGRGGVERDRGDARPAGRRRHRNIRDGVFWRSWWLGGLARGLVVVPLALAWAHARRSLWRGRRAVDAALMLATVAGLSGIALSAHQPLPYIVFPAFIWAALRLGPQGATLAVAVAAVIAVLATSNQLGPFVEHSPTDSALNLQLYIIFAALTTSCLAAIVSERRHTALELAESQRREGERAALERQRIARDLHDSVSQSLFSTTLHVRTAQHALELEKLDSTGPVGEELSEIGQLTRGALAEMRALIFELQPGALAEEGLVAALAKQASALSAREGLAIEVDGPDERLPIAAEVEEQLYRVGQEALANVVKHARATSATVRVAATDNSV